MNTFKLETITNLFKKNKKCLGWGKGGILF